MVQVRALSLKQPYANLVASGKKTIETRVWGTDYRGDILIVSSRSGQGEPKGMALCVVRLDNVRMMTQNDETSACTTLYPRARAWELSHLRVLRRPFPIKGQLGLFRLKLDPDILQYKTK